jgi:AcrR family transcriptional regulator
MQVFWRNGFSGTSYPDLMAATGLNKSSIYNAFGDKQALYRRCLDRFARVHGERLRTRLEAPGLADAVGGFFDQLIERFRCPDLPDGCMMTAAALELGGRDVTVGDRIRDQMRDLERLFRQRLDQAVGDAELPEDADTAALASLLLAMTRGLAALHRGYGDLRAVGRAKRAMMQLLEAPPLKGRPN